MNEISGKRAFKLWPFLLVSALSFGQAVEQKPKIICDHAAPPRGMHYVCKSQCDCHLEGKLKNDEDGIAPTSTGSSALASRPENLKIVTVRSTEMDKNVFHSTETVYIQGGRARLDSHATLPGGSVHEQGFIELCDEHKTIELDPQQKQYQVVELGQDGLAKGWKKDTLQDARDARPGGTVEIVTENTDTHETRELLGHVAHHWLTKRETIPGPGACAQAEVSEIDGWYIDYKQPPISCSTRVQQNRITNTGSAHAVSLVQNGCKDKFVFKGEQIEHGMTVLSNHRSHFQGKMHDGTSRSFVSHTKLEVAELSTSPIPATVFDIPAGYKRVARVQTSMPPRNFGERLDLWWEELKIALGK